MFGAATLGTYNISYEFANLPTTELGAPINRALLPGFAKMESGGPTWHRPMATPSACWRGWRCRWPPACSQWHRIFVPAILGTKWLDAVPLMRALALNGVVLMLQASMCAVLVARGHPARVAAANIIYLIVLLPMLGVFALQFGIVGVAYAALLSGIVCTPMYLWQIQRSIRIRPSVFLRAIWRPALASLGMVALVMWALPAYTVTMSLAQTVGWLLAGISVGVGAYLLFASMLWLIVGKPAGPERVLIERARALLPGRPH